MATNMAEVLKLAVRPTPSDNDERTWLEFRLKLENYLTPVNEKYVALLQDAVSRTVVNVTTGTDDTSVLIRTLGHSLCAMLATLTTGRRLRLVQQASTRNGFEAWRQLVAENAPKHSGSKIRMFQAVLQPGMGDNPAKFDETLKAWEHRVDVYDTLAASKLDDDVTISVVLREAPSKHRDSLLVKSQQLESNYKKLQTIIQAYLNLNKSWIANTCKN